MEWVVLLLLVPAIVVPIVLLFGFAGCSFPHGVAALRPPTIASATPLDNNAVELTWTDTNAGPVSFEVERQKGNESPLPPFAATSPFVDGPLEGRTKYTYRVRTIIASDANPTSWSAPATVETWAQAFTAPLEQAGENATARGDCIVQRLSPGSLSRPGNLIAITVRGATNADLVLSRVTISSPALSGDDFDSAAGLQDITTSPQMVTAGLPHRLPTVAFTADPDEPLLIAFDVGNPGNARLARGVPHTVYIKTPPPGGAITEAGTQNRAGFMEQPSQLWLIDAVYVATKWPPIP
jgi:hypothetical protein